MANVDNLIDAITLAMADALKPPLEDVADGIRRRISVPVGRDSRRRVIQRSKPGEPPRLEHGNLRASVDVAVIDSGTTIRGSIGIGGGDVTYARILNDEKNRPIVGDEFEKRTDAIVDSLAASVARIQPGE